MLNNFHKNFFSKKCYAKLWAKLKTRVLSWAWLSGSAPDFESNSTGFESHLRRIDFEAGLFGTHSTFLKKSSSSIQIFVKISLFHLKIQGGVQKTGHRKIFKYSLFSKKQQQ